MSKRRGEDSPSQIAGKRSRPEPKKHLYLVFDDWEKGYSIRQIDPDTMLSNSSDDDLVYAVVDLPEPAAFRFVAHARDTQFFAMGSSNIVAVSSGVEATESSPPTLVYDTAAAALATAPPLPGHLAGPIIPVADSLYAPTTLGAGMPTAFEAFSCSPYTDEPSSPRRMHEWSWKSVDALRPPAPAWRRRFVVSYAAHPDGHTVFVTTRDASIGGGVAMTYAFDVERREWTPLGLWALPFLGQGHFDVELDAWVGLDEDPGYICACQVPSRSRYTTVPPESDKMEERLFGARDERTLTYMGDSKFCLVVSVGLEDAEEEEESVYDREVRVTTFGLKFDRKGELRTTTDRKTSSYLAPRYVSSFSPVAFWM
ncbi:hypothetical protein HU200_004051 [Digitaria exilis]|uniref:Uncharacterized protein n=1 Tax=Digitaria exilis TaxID=1010633 RepID=A0A835FVN3_9POAL|nr:hypothetical protein HU200_004051 [Digitaria exilis]